MARVGLKRSVAFHFNIFVSKNIYIIAEFYIVVLDIASYDTYIPVIYIRFKSNPNAELQELLGSDRPTYRAVKVDVTSFHVYRSYPKHQVVRGGVGSTVDDDTLDVLKASEEVTQHGHPSSRHFAISTCRITFPR